MLRVQANKALRGFDGRLRLVGAVVRVDHLQLRLLGVAPEGITRLQGLQGANGQVVVAAVQIALRLIVDLSFAAVCEIVDFIAVAAAGAQKQDEKRRDKGRQKARPAGIGKNLLGELQS